MVRIDDIPSARSTVIHQGRQVSVTGTNSRENLAVHRAICTVDDATVPMKVQVAVTLTRVRPVADSEGGPRGPGPPLRERQKM